MAAPLTLRKRLELLLVRRSLLGVFMLGVVLDAAGAMRLTLSVQDLEHPRFSAHGVRMELSAPGAATAELSAASLRVGDRRFSQVKLRCAVLSRTEDRIDCPSARLTQPGVGALPLRFSYSPAAERFELALEPGRAERWRFVATMRSGAPGLEITLENASLAQLSRWSPEVAEFKLNAVANGRIRWAMADRSQRLTADLRVEGVSFGNAEGTRAGDKIGARLTLDARRQAAAWSWRGALRWDHGEAYFQPYYLSQPELALTLAGTLTAESLRITSGHAELAGVGGADFDAEVSRFSYALHAGSVKTSGIDLARAAALFLTPLTESRGLPRYDLGGRAWLSATVESGSVTGIDLRLEDGSLTEGRGRFSLKGITGAIPWRRDARTEPRIDVAGGEIGGLPLGAFTLRPSVHGLSFEIASARIPALDGLLLVEGVQARRQADHWDWKLGGALQPVSMTALTESLGLPRMSGTMSASIPTISQKGSTISMDGALIIQVFDGFLSATGLRIIEPFGLVPRLYADVELRNLNLGQLTETYSFGSITGFIDGEIKGLEMAGLRPLQFDAKVMSAPGEYRKRISQRAVQNISALGGAGAAAAIQRSFLGVFEEFGYSALGWSCKLRNDSCEMGGLENTGNGYVIVKGGGVPAINVIGYNRRVDWSELVMRLKRVTQSDAKPIIQ